MNLPNLLTLSRIFLSFILIYLIIQDGLAFKVLAAVVFIIASLTDLLDGYFAKKKNLTTNFGKLMDPIADKVLILSCLIIFMLMNLVPEWMVLVITAREVGMTLWRLQLVNAGRVHAAERMGKYKTVSQTTAISFILLFLVLKEMPLAQSWSQDVYLGWYYAIQLLMLIVVFLTIFSGVLYWLHRNEQS